nr:hypothetical protein [Tanacetum cinerariifolium]
MIQVKQNPSPLQAPLLFREISRSLNLEDLKFSRGELQATTAVTLDNHGDENGLKRELVPPLESSGGQLPLDKIELESLCYMQRNMKPCDYPISR